MLNLEVNYLGVLIAAIVNIIIGFLWYGPLFGKLWTKESGIPLKKLENKKNKKVGSTYIAMFASSLIFSCVLSIILNSIEINLIIDAILTAVLIWFGFFAAIMLGQILWERKSLKLYLINSFYYLFSLILMSIVIVLI